LELGEELGEPEGESLGLDVGDFDGDVVAEFDGALDGAGLFVGLSLGAELGKNYPTAKRSVMPSETWLVIPMAIQSDLRSVCDLEKNSVTTTGKRLVK